MSNLVKKENNAVAMSNIENTAKRIIEQGMGPTKKDRDTGEMVQALTWQQLAIIGQRGKEVGIDPVQAMNEIYIVQNKPMFKAELVLELMYKNIPGFYHIVEKFEEDEVVATFYSSRLPEKGVRRSLTREYADNAEWSLQKNWSTKKLEVKDNWKKDPIGMLFNRLISQVARTQFPNYKTLINIYLPEFEDAEVAMHDLTGDDVIETTVSTGETVSINQNTGEFIEQADTVDADFVEAEVVDEEPVAEKKSKPVINKKADSNGEFECEVEGCTNTVPEKVKNFSMKAFGKCLCYEHQNDKSVIGE